MSLVIKKLEPEVPYAIGHPIAFAVELDIQETDSPSSAKIIYDIDKSDGTKWKIIYISEPKLKKKSNQKSLYWEIHASAIEIGEQNYPEVTLDYKGKKIKSQSTEKISILKQYKEMNSQYLESYSKTAGIPYAPKEIEFQTLYAVKNLSLVLFLFIAVVFSSLFIKRRFLNKSSLHSEEFINPLQPWQDGESEVLKVQSEWKNGNLSSKNGAFKLSTVIKDLLTIRYNIPISESTSWEVVKLSEKYIGSNHDEIKLKKKLIDFLKHTDPIKYMSSKDEPNDWKNQSVDFAIEIINLSKPIIIKESESGSDEV